MSDIHVCYSFNGNTFQEKKTKSKEKATSRNAVSVCNTYMYKLYNSHDMYLTVFEYLFYKLSYVQAHYSTGAVSQSFTSTSTEVATENEAGIVQCGTYMYMFMYM